MLGAPRLRVLATALLAWVAGDSMALAQSQPAVRIGETLLSAPLPYARTGHLQNNVIRSALGNDTPSLRAGTPVFQMTYHYALSSAGATVLQYRRPMWCGVSDVRGRPQGFCVVMFEDGARIARVIAGSPYYPRELSRLLPCNEPEIVDDPAVAATLPTRQLSYVVERLRANRLRLAVSVRVGEQTSALDRIDLARTRENTFVLSEGAFSLTIRHDGESAVVRDAIGAAQISALADARNVLTKEGWVGLGPGSY